MTDQTEAITPLAYGLLETRTLKLLTTHVYVYEETACHGAERLTNKFRTYVVVPLFGPDTYAVMASGLEAAQNAEAALRRKTIELTNQIASLRGEVLASDHAARRPFRSGI